ncbi:MAG: hypothetical protein ACE5JL_05995 [Dehalococcoidia bacterium]
MAARESLWQWQHRQTLRYEKQRGLVARDIDRMTAKENLDLVKFTSSIPGRCYVG